MATEPTAILNRLLDGEALEEPVASALMKLLTDEDLPPATAGALLAALRAKGETPEEVRGFAGAMRELAKPVTLPAGLHAADSVGTGGDGSGSLNLSTGTALVAAACGIPMIKHGNRSVSSKCGSADVLEALGVPLAPDADTALDCLEACGFAFLFAPFFHPAMKAIGPVRAAMGVRTVFNILGPLANPAAPPYHLVGAFDLPRARLMADTLSGMDIERAFVVHGDPGWDEATPCGTFTLFDVRPGSVKEEIRDPKDSGVARCTPYDLAGGNAEANAAALAAVLAGTEQGPHRDALTLGAGLLLEVTGRADDMRSGIATAEAALEAGKGQAVLDRLREFAGRLPA